MPRVLCFLAFVLLQACASPEKPFALPKTVAGGWHLKQTKREGGTTLGVYEGPGTVRVEAEDMKVQAVAFERTQKTRPEPDMVFFDKGVWFVTIRWEQADREALKQLVRALQKQP